MESVTPFLAASIHLSKLICSDLLADTYRKILLHVIVLIASADGNLLPRGDVKRVVGDGGVIPMA
jgi:hypothetical protein